VVHAAQPVTLTLLSWQMQPLPQLFVERVYVLKYSSLGLDMSYQSW
jgi:hypothetical protein